MILIRHQLLNVQRVRPPTTIRPGILSPKEVRAYFTHVLGDARVPDGQGGCWGECLFRRHLMPIYINFIDGHWECSGGCGRGDIVKFEMNRSRITDYQKGREAVLNIIAEALAQAEDTANKANRAFAGQLLPGTTVADRDADSLLARIARHPGRSRRYLQQGSHWSGQRFGRALGRLERLGLVKCDDQPTTGGRRRRTYCVSTKCEQPSGSQGSV